MPDTVFRTPIESTKEIDTQPIKASEQARAVEPTVEPPYLDYGQNTSKPYVADRYGLGDNWDDPYGGFPVEIGNIESYIKSQIQNGEIANTNKAVQNELSRIEKLTNIGKEERSIIKINTVAAYIKFLQETNDIKSQIRRYNANA